ncbi:MAG: MFS transporter [Tenacibaculum sp.]
MNNSKAANKIHFNTIGLVMIIFFVISFITNILNSIIVDIKDSFNLSLTLTGLLPFTFFIAYGIMSIPAGLLSEKYSQKTLLSVSFLLMTLVCLIFSQYPNYSVFSITLFILGCCMAVLQVIINPMLRVAGGEEHFAFNSVLAQLVFGAASFVSPYLYKYLVNNKTGSNKIIAEILHGWIPANLPWVSLYIVFAIISLLLLFYVFFTKYPKFEKTENERAGDGSSYQNLLKNKWAVLYFLGIFCYVGTEQCVGNWISQFLYNYHSINPQTLGADTVSYFWAMLTIGYFLGLLLLKLIDSRKLLIMATFTTIICLVFTLTGSVKMALIGFPLIGFFISVMYSIIFSLALNSVDQHHGSLSGILCTGIAGGAVIPFIVGGLGEMISLKFGMLFLTIPLAFILSIGFWAKPLVGNKTIRLKKQQ